MLQTLIGKDAAAQDAKRTRIALCLLVAATIAGVLLAHPFWLLRDPDTWWHVKVGLDLLASWTFPTTDTYSHTFAGQPWIAKEWLGQVFLALAYKAAGWNGVVLLTVATIALTIFLFAQRVSRDLRPSLTFGLVFVFTFLLITVYNARPYIFTFPIIVVWTARLYEAAEREEPPPLWLLPLMVLWANLHPAYFIGFAVAFFAFLDLFARVWFSKPRLLVRWIAFGLACPIAVLTTPYGVQVIPLIFNLASGHEAVPFLSEWRPFNAREIYLHHTVLMALLFGLLASGFRTSWPKALFIVFALHMFLSHVRFMYLVLLLVPIVISADVARQYSALSTCVWAKRQRDMLERLFATRSAALAGVVAMLLACVFTVSLMRVEPDYSAPDALGFAKERGLTGNVYNSYGFGGTLIFHGIKTFIDGRTDQLFLGGFTKDDMELMTGFGRAKLTKKLDDYGVSWTLLTPADPRVAIFNELPGWRLAYSDKHAVIHVREGSTK